MVIWQQELADALAKVETLGREFGFASLQESIEICRGHLAQDDVVEVGVFGRFKVGKSSLINALVGGAVLPVGVLPVTAIVTRLRYASTERVRVAFLDRTERDIPLDQLPGYVTESENPDNRKRVASVLVETSGLSQYPGVEFFDTPGSGSLHAHNSEVARQWIPRSGLALVAVSADEPLSEADADLIAELRRSVPRLAVVLTKADRLTDAELQQVVAYLRAQLRQRFPDEIPVFPFCSVARPADARVGGWRRELDEQWLLPLARCRSAEQHRVVLHKTRALLDGASALVQVALRSAEQSAAERERMRAFVLEEDQVLPMVQRELRLCGRAAVAGLMERTHAMLRPSYPILVARGRGVLDRQWGPWRARRLGLARLTRAYKEFLSDFIAREMRRLADEQRTAMLTPLSQTAAELGRITLAFRDRLAGRVTAGLGVELSFGEHRPVVRVPETPDIAIGMVFDTPWDLLSFLVPVPLVRPLLRRHFNRRLAWETEKHLSRTAAQWSERVAQAVQEATAAEEQYVGELVKTATSALSSTQDQGSALRRAAEDLERWRDAIRLDAIPAESAHEDARTQEEHG